MSMEATHSHGPNRRIQPLPPDFRHTDSVRERDLPRTLRAAGRDDDAAVLDEIMAMERLPT